MKRYDIILLDIDGTLLDFSQAEFYAFKETMESYEIPYSSELYSTYHQINKGLWEALERGEVTKEELRIRRFKELLEHIESTKDVATISHDYEKALGEGAYLMDGAIEICEVLKKECSLAVVTNGIAAIQYNRLAKSGLDKLFGAIFISEELEASKPQKVFFDKVFAELEISDLSRVLIVGDSLSADIKGGNVAGIDTCWFNPSQNKPSEEVTITYEISRLSELEGIILGKE